MGVDDEDSVTSLWKLCVKLSQLQQVHVRVDRCVCVSDANSDS